MATIDGLIEEILTEMPDLIPEWQTFFDLDIQFEVDGVTLAGWIEVEDHFGTSHAWIADGIEAKYCPGRMYDRRKSKPAY